MTKDMRGRQRCCVPGCGRTYKDEGHSEIICGKHWRMADAALRQLLARVRRRARHRGWTSSRVRLDNRIWERARDQAIGRAMGL